MTQIVEKPLSNRDAQIQALGFDPHHCGPLGKTARATISLALGGKRPYNPHDLEEAVLHVKRCSGCKGAIALAIARNEATKYGVDVQETLVQASAKLSGVRARTESRHRFTWDD